jgi:hypothetical protein
LQHGEVDHSSFEESSSHRLHTWLGPTCSVVMRFGIHLAHIESKHFGIDFWCHDAQEVVLLKDIKRWNKVSRIQRSFAYDNLHAPHARC